MGFALGSVRQAGRLCRAVQAEIDPGALAKKDRSPVTVADFGSQALICRTLREAFPDDPIIGEEDAAVLHGPDQAPMLARVTEHVAKLRPGVDSEQVCEWIDYGGAKDYTSRFWTLDPIDGTKGFLRGGQYAIALALILDGQVAAAVLGCPNLGPTLDADRGDGSLFVALKGHGTWSLPLLGEGEPVPVKVSGQTDCAFIRFCESVEAAHSSHGDAARLATELKIQAAPARLDSQAKYAVVARGEAEAYLRPPPDQGYRGECNFEYMLDYAIDYASPESAPAAGLSCRYPVDFDLHQRDRWPAFILDIMPSGYGRQQWLEQLELKDGPQSESIKPPQPFLLEFSIVNHPNSFGVSHRVQDRAQTA